MKLRVIGIILIIVGVSVILYPTMKSYYYTEKQKRILSEWNKEISTIPISDTLEMNTLENDKDNDSLDVKENTDGVINIESIELHQPILRGATTSNLKISVAKLESDAIIGGLGNYVIVGHNSRTFGKNFNRLDEVNIGDVIELDNGNEKFDYIVYDKFIVSPEEIWVTKQNKNVKEVTLITCDYSTDPSSRLIIKAKIE